MQRLDHDEYVEQAHFFRTLGERLPQNMPLQDLLLSCRTRSWRPRSCLRVGVSARRAETFRRDRRGDGEAAALFHARSRPTSCRRRKTSEVVLTCGWLSNCCACEAEYLARGATRQGMFMYQFECLCRNRLRYERGLDAMAR